MNKTQTINGILKSDFDKGVGGKPTSLYILTNKLGMEVSITNYGGRVVTLHVPNNNNELVDIVLGYSNLSGYQNDGSYFGALIGRTGNRIAGGKFSIDNTQYQVTVNSGSNSLHGGKVGFNAVVWEANQMDDRTLRLYYQSKDKEEGYPGNLDVAVTYQLGDDSNTLQIHYEASADKDTIINMTNHSYFNLLGAGNSTINEHTLTLNCDSYTPTDSNQIPTGQIVSVAGTPFDFRTAQTIGSRIDSSDAQIKIGGGYDHNFVINRSSGGANALVLAGKVVAPSKGITMTVSTTEPGVQLYTANTISVTGKENKRYGNRCALCLETQHYPDAPNHSNFPSIVLRRGAQYDTTTVYSFSVEGSRLGMGMGLGMRSLPSLLSSLLTPPPLPALTPAPASSSSSSSASTSALASSTSPSPSSSSSCSFLAKIGKVLLIILLIGVGLLILVAFIRFLRSLFNF